ncbi:MAG: hypothetical protein KBA30_11455 [Clostridia bacterium]|nr:hypothetical protein [Clostridia bacterium]
MSRCISSDTNIWNDFREVGRLDLPFRLDHRFHIAKMVFQNEMVVPGYFDERILEYGLCLVSFSDVEMQCAESIRLAHPKLSIADGLAYAIAKHRGWTLLTGDGLLRKVALDQGVDVRGTLWIIDELQERNAADGPELLQVCEAMLRMVHARILRLPIHELQERAVRFRKEIASPADS